MRLGHRTMRLEEKPRVDGSHTSSSAVCEPPPGQGLPATPGSVEDQCGRFGAGGVGGPVGLPTGRTPKVNKFALTAVGSLAAALTLAGCGSGTPSAQPSHTPTPSATAPAWESSYTPSQIADYSSAVAAYQRIEGEEAPLWAAGVMTAAARVTFARDWVNPNVPQNMLIFFAQNKVRTTGVPKLLSSRLTKVTEMAGVGEVLQINECVDTSSVHETQRGKAVRNPYSRLARVVEVVKTPSGRFAAASVQALKAC